MVASHLKQRNGWWYYQRRRPDEYEAVEPRKIIAFALRTKNAAEARLKAARISYDLEQEWTAAITRRTALQADASTLKHKAAQEFQRELGFEPKQADSIDGDELVERLRALLSGSFSATEQAAAIGLTTMPKISMSEALERFWDHIKDEWMDQSHDQQRGKRNIYQKSIRNFEKPLGKYLFLMSKDQTH